MADRLKPLYIGCGMVLSKSRYWSLVGIRIGILLGTFIYDIIYKYITFRTYLYSGGKITEGDIFTAEDNYFGPGGFWMAATTFSWMLGPILAFKVRVLFFQAFWNYLQIQITLKVGSCMSQPNLYPGAAFNNLFLKMY